MKRLAPLIIALVLLAACSKHDKSDSNGAQQTGQAQTEQAFKQQSASVPYPANEMKDSLERRNLREKLLRLNRPDKIGYVYLLNDNGGIVAYYTIKGKVSSNDSQMTTSQLVIQKSTRCRTIPDVVCTPTVVNAPSDDGSYGPNEAGIFFFTTEDVLVEYSGKWLYADAPLKVDASKLEIQYDASTAKPSSVGEPQNKRPGG